MVPVSNGECISTPFPRAAQEPAGIQLEFSQRPHHVHRIPPVIRTSRRLSTGLCTSGPQVTRRNSENTSTWSHYVIVRSFLRDVRLTTRSSNMPRAGPPRHHPAEPATSGRAGKYDCPLPGAGLPWMYDDTAGARTRRVHEPALAACGCPDRRSGCQVSASRHLPAAAPGKSLGAVFICVEMGRIRLSLSYGLALLTPP